MTTDSQRNARGARTSLAAVVLTAQHGESEEKALDPGARNYLTKPSRTRALAARVRAMLERINA
jgi:DNA-binding response OmpR family regulator